MDSCYSTWLATSHNVSTRCLCTWTAENSKAKLHTQGHPELSSTAGRWFCHSLFSPHRSSPSLFSSFLPTVSLHALSRCVHPSLHLKNLKVEVISLHPHHLDPHTSPVIHPLPHQEGSFFLLTAHSTTHLDLILFHQPWASFPCCSFTLLHRQLLSTCSFLSFYKETDFWNSEQQFLDPGFFVFLFCSLDSCLED